MMSRMVRKLMMIPTEYMKPSGPKRDMSPVIPRKVAAERKSPAMAQPFCIPEIPPPAA